MSELKPIASVDEASVRWPGVVEGNQQALRRFLFHAAGHFPNELHQELDDKRSERTPAESTLYNALRSLRYASEGSRLERATHIARHTAFNVDTERVVGNFDPTSPDSALETARSFFDRWPASMRFQFVRSPLYPEGRRVYAPIDYRAEQVSIPYKVERVIRLGSDDIEAPEALTKFIESGYRAAKARSQITQSVLEAPRADMDILEGLRQLYGAKAANLMLFAEHLELLKNTVGEKYYQQAIDIPPFIPVDTSLYESWQHNTAMFEKQLAELNAAALKLVTNEGKFDEDGYPIADMRRVVAIRSSAVRSEDGEDMTGAGVYDSVAVDPRDPIAFRQAIEKVFASTNSPRAVQYRKQHGIDGEQMGLVIQQYCDTLSDHWGDKTPIGTVDSQAFHPNLIAVETQHGGLLFDKVKVTKHLLTSIDSAKILHTIPDHRIDGIGGHSTQHTHSAVHAALLAEQFFGKPVQVEFYGNNILQVRPLPRKSLEGIRRQVDFPSHIAPIDWCRATGVGDVTLKLLNEERSNVNDNGVVIFWNENRFTITGVKDGHQGEDALPREGAVIIVNNDGYSGHAQMLCREKGLICLFPDVGVEMRIDGVLRELRRSGANTPMLRIVSDGYKGAVYLVDPQEHAEKQALLQRIADNLAHLALKGKNASQHDTPPPENTLFN